MIRFLLRRIYQSIIVLILVTLATFLLFFAGDPKAVAHRLAGRQATPEQVNAIYHNLGLDQNIFVQYFHFITKIVLHWDFGTDYYHHVPVTTVLKQDAPVTISLVIGGAVIWFVIGVASGVYSAVRPRTLMDRSFTGLALFFYSLPVFVLGFAFIYLASKDNFSTFPAANYVGLAHPFEWFRHLVMPWFTLALISAAAYTRLSRTSMLEVLGEDYIRTARAKGVREWRVVIKHALRSALTPVITQFGVDVAVALGGAILTESVFSLPGLGRESVIAITNQDLPVIIGIVIIAALAVVVMNIIVDMLYAVLDPRVTLH
ncbi:ABC transporter permease [uncultured Jatrophihabitans sp.]|uniref:ABC transporter permease n=1 Tax=uncultured Jatrophihabitans sp. TaxID=1610747 RepID=UPI0035CA2737